MDSYFVVRYLYKKTQPSAFLHSFLKFFMKNKKKVEETLLKFRIHIMVIMLMEFYDCVTTSSQLKKGIT